VKVQALIVDDFSIIRKLVAQGLERNYDDIIVEEAKNGKEAQEMMTKNKYDLVICDWGMPVMTGEELLKWIRNHPGLNQTPFIMLTSKSEKEYVMRAVNAGVNSYLIKPFTIADLLQKISTTVDIFNRRQPERYEIEGPVTIRFDAHRITGNLIDISLGGLLSFFKRGDMLPAILDKVSVNLELAQNMAFSDMEGFIIRVQPAEARIDSKYIKYAIKFMNVNAETEARLSQYLKKVYPHQW
jgi:CheY-like chemotaxis protein